MKTNKTKKFMEWSGTDVRMVQVTYGHTHPTPHTSPLILVS